MNHKYGSFSRLAASILLTATTLSASAMSFVRGDTYTSNYFSRTINHYDASGNFVDSMEVSAAYGSEVKGLAFGKDNLLYAVTVQGSNFGVIALDQSGNVHQTYSGTSYLAGNLSDGKITFGDNGKFYVSGSDDLVEFTTGVSAGTSIYQNNQVFDTALMPTGDLLALSAYGIQELTPDGVVVRTIDPSTRLVDARGIAYDAATNDIYVSMLGETGEFFRLLRLDGTTGQVDKDVGFWYADDLFLTSDDRLLVGSRTLAPAVFDLDLNALGSIGTEQQMFVTQMSAVPEPSEALLLASAGMLMLAGMVRRRAARKAGR